jgi:predicted ester cyclase
MAIADPSVLLRRLYKEVLGEGRLEVLDELLAPNFFDRSFPDDGIPGKERFQASVEAFRAAFPHAEWTVSDVQVKGDLVTARLRWQAKHEGEFLGVDPTGETVGAESVSCFRLLNGQFVEHWSVDSDSDVADKLGMNKLPGSGGGGR